MQKIAFFIIENNPQVLSSMPVTLDASTHKHFLYQINFLNQFVSGEVIFYFFNNKKLFFAFFIKLIWLGVGFLNRTGAEIGY